MPQDGYGVDESFPHDGKQRRCGCGEGYSWDDNDGKVKRRWSEWDYLRKRQLQRHMIKKIRNR